MIKLEAGLRVAAVDFGGWDTHEYQNDGNSGYIVDLLSRDVYKRQTASLCQSTTES